MRIHSMEESDGSELEGSESEGCESVASESEEVEPADVEADGSESDGSDTLETDVQCAELEVDDGIPLLPGIPNEIIVDQICIKLPWEAFLILLKVSPSWRKAIRSRRVLGARLRSQSAETLMVHTHPFELDFSCEQLYLYSAREERCYELPRIRSINRGIPWECQCISLDGKIYVLGGGTGYGHACEGEDDKDKKVFNKVYSLDLVAGKGGGGGGEGGGGRGSWRRCASMKEERLKFGCGVIGGKIYVFGGASHYGPVGGCEVYDPKANSWSPIKPMKRLRFGHHVAIVGDVFLVYGGEIFDEGYGGGPGRKRRLLDEYEIRVPNKSVHDAGILEAYHPGKDEWRVVEPFRKLDTESLFMADGKMHLLTQLGVYVQDLESSPWKELYSHSLPGVGRGTDYIVMPGATVVAGDVLYVNVRWEWKGSRSLYEGVALCEGRGFGSDDVEIVWKKVKCEDAYGEARMEYAEVICPIKL